MGGVGTQVIVALALAELSTLRPATH